MKTTFEIETDELGTVSYYKDNKYHRTDGPAVQRPEGYKAWYLNGERHREDGPAVEALKCDYEKWI